MFGFFCLKRKKKKRKKENLAYYLCIPMYPLFLEWEKLSGIAIPFLIFIFISQTSTLFSQSCIIPIRKNLAQIFWLIYHRDKLTYHHKNKILVGSRFHKIVVNMNLSHIVSYHHQFHNLTLQLKHHLRVPLRYIVQRKQLGLHSISSKSQNS